MTTRLKPRSKDAPFTSLKLLDRYRAVCLGLPVPLWYGEVPPWGYDLDPENPGWCIPDEQALRSLYIASVEVRKERSLRDMAEWLGQATGRKISHNGLVMLLKSRPPFKEINLPYEERLEIHGFDQFTSATTEDK